MFSYGFNPLFFNFSYLLFIAPAVLLGLWAQFRIRSTYHAAQQEPAPLSGAAAAKHILESAGIHDVRVEPIPGHLSDHYDPRDKVLRLSPEVYQGRTLAAVGIAAHEAGHALQHAHQYAPLAIRNAAVPVANFGSGFGVLLIVLGAIMSIKALLFVGIALFSAVVFFQLVNLPVEFNASSRAKAELVQLGIVPAREMGSVNRVLNAAALTYVAGTLQSVLTLVYYITQFTGGRDES